MSIFKDIKLWAARRRYKPARETLAYPKLVSILGANVGAQMKPTPGNLRYFSRTPYARRAINAIKSPIASLGWEVSPLPEYSKSRIARDEAETIAKCLENPNDIDSFRSLLEQIIEDALVNGAGVIEYQLSGSAARPLWLWPVDSTTIQPLATWDGNPKSIRYVQARGYNSSFISQVNSIQLKDEEILYMRINPSTETPYGYGPLEVAYQSISRQLGVSLYAANLASNTAPQNMIYVGQATPDEIIQFRAYWRNEVEGQGQTPIIGNSIKPDVLKLHGGGDSALYLKYQEWLVREIATAFGISPQNLGIERDVNRSTGDVATDRDWDSAIKPMAHLVESHINRHAIAGRLGMPHIRFRFVGLDRKDEAATANIYQTYYRSNAITPNEQRDRLGLQPLKSIWGDMTYADVQIAVRAAQGAKQVDDQNLKGDSNGS